MLWYGPKHCCVLWSVFWIRFIWIWIWIRSRSRSANPFGELTDLDEGLRIRFHLKKALIGSGSSQRKKDPSGSGSTTLIMILSNVDNLSFNYVSHLNKKFICIWIVSILLWKLCLDQKRFWFINCFVELVRKASSASCGGSVGGPLDVPPRAGGSLPPPRPPDYQTTMGRNLKTGLRPRLSRTQSRDSGGPEAEDETQVSAV